MVLEKVIARKILSLDYFIVDNPEYVDPVLMDLSKACYDCIPHDLLITKLEAYGLDKTSSHLLRDYLSDRKQRAKIGSSFTD